NTTDASEESGKSRDCAQTRRHAQLCVGTDSEPLAPPASCGDVRFLSGIELQRVHRSMIGRISAALNARRPVTTQDLRSSHSVLRSSLASCCRIIRLVFSLEDMMAEICPFRGGGYDM